MEMYKRWIKEAEELELRAKEIRKNAEKIREAMNIIQIGVLIEDLDTEKLMRVSKLKNGSNDFEANPIDAGIGRGYLYLAENWRVVK
ncbi:hypothetical protein [Bacillus sp. NPDC094106]|uniref:hypothetical protein n=1 Tax=Bacillus sp. NPDC094106 TaxID=3363949 RepID=UPI003806EB2D